MKTRLITAAVGVPFLIFVLVVRGWFAELVIAAADDHRDAGVLSRAGQRRATTSATWGGYVGGGRRCGR